MPQRFQRNSIGELVCRVPLHRGSLLKSIENLVKTIETSENAVMIPTLLRDKVRVDAWELLFVAKILKASILGHDDLVEFYMNHIHQNGLSTATSNGTQSASQTPNGLGSPALSPLLLRQQSSPAATATASHPLKEEPSASHSSASSTSSSQSNSTAATTTPNTATGHTNQSQVASKSTSSSASWTTAPNNPNSQPASSSSAFNSAASSLTGPLSESAVSLDAISSLKLAPEEPPPSSPTLSTISAQDGGSLASSRPLVARMAQPPSLLQLTTTNNHINSVSELLNSSPLDPSLDVLSQHLVSLHQQQQLASSSGPFEFGSGLSLTIPNGAVPGGAGEAGASSQAATPTTVRHELRSSRSAGCLFRANSGALSPRTPATPYPQAETLAGSANQNGLSGDPTSLVRLLLQVEQLKASIVHVNMLLESVVDLYKKSIDNISQ